MYGRNWIVCIYMAGMNWIACSVSLCSILGASFQCVWSPDMRHKEITIQERERERDWIERSNIFQQLFCRSRIVAIGAPLWVHHFSLGSMLYVRKTHTTLDTACMLAYRPCPTYNNPSFACRPYIHTVVLIVGMRERERDMNLRLDFVWILCIHPSTREGTMKSTGFLQARCHPSLNASTACTGTAAITEPCSCL